MMESGETLLNNHWLGNRGGSLAFLVGTIINVLVMEIGWTDVLVLFYLFYHIFTVKQSRKLDFQTRHVLGTLENQIKYTIKYWLLLFIHEQIGQFIQQINLDRILSFCLFHAISVITLYQFDLWKYPFSVITLSIF